MRSPRVRSHCSRPPRAAPRVSRHSQHLLTRRHSRTARRARYDTKTRTRFRISGRASASSTVGGLLARLRSGRRGQAHRPLRGACEILDKGRQGTFSQRGRTETCCWRSWSVLQASRRFHAGSFRSSRLPPEARSRERRPGILEQSDATQPVSVALPLYIQVLGEPKHIRCLTGQAAPQTTGETCTAGKDTRCRGVGVCTLRGPRPKRAQAFLRDIAPLRACPSAAD